MIIVELITSKIYECNMAARDSSEHRRTKSGPILGTRRLKGANCLYITWTRQDWPSSFNRDSLNRQPYIWKLFISLYFVRSDWINLDQVDIQSLSTIKNSLLATAFTSLTPSRLVRPGSWPLLQSSYIPRIQSSTFLIICNRSFQHWWDQVRELSTVSYFRRHRRESTTFIIRWSVNLIFLLISPRLSPSWQDLEPAIQRTTPIYIMFLLPASASTFGFLLEYISSRNVRSRNKHGQWTRPDRLSSSQVTNHSIAALLTTETHSKTNKFKSFGHASLSCWLDPCLLIVG